jgi:hypothetical protein
MNRDKLKYNFFKYLILYLIFSNYIIFHRIIKESYKIYIKLV